MCSCFSDLSVQHDWNTRNPEHFWEVHKAFSACEPITEQVTYSVSRERKYGESPEPDHFKVYEVIWDYWHNIIYFYMIQPTWSLKASSDWSQAISTVSLSTELYSYLITLPLVYPAILQLVHMNIYSPVHNWLNLSSFSTSLEISLIK